MLQVLCTDCFSQIGSQAVFKAVNQTEQTKIELEKNACRHAKAPSVWSKSLTPFRCSSLAHLSKAFIKRHPNLVTKDPGGGFKKTFKASFIILENLIVPAGEPWFNPEENSWLRLTAAVNIPVHFLAVVVLLW